MKQILANRPIWGSLLLLYCLASEAPRADPRRLSEFPACGVKLHLQHPSSEYLSGRGLEDVYCATSSTLEFVPDENGVPVYIGVGCCDDAGVCHRHDGANNNAGCFAGWYDEPSNVLGDPKTWDQAVELCHNEGKELCAAPLSMGICLYLGCWYNELYQWSTTECEPGDANYQEDCETAPTLPTTTGYVMDDTTIRTAVVAWLSNSASAEAKYGHISRWETGGVTSMMGLFRWYYRSFNEDISSWDTSSVTDMKEMFSDTSSFNQDLSGWDVSAVTTMEDIFEDAEDFDQDLGWCLDNSVVLTDAFKKAKCESTSCGVAQKDAIGICEPWARPCLIGTKDQCHINSPTLIIMIMLVLLAGAGAYVRQRKKDDETYVAAARRLLCCLCYRNETDSNSVTSSQPASPAESPPDQPEKVGLPGRGWVYTESGTQKTCKHCGQTLSQSMFVEKQWKKPRPTCVDCASRLSAQNAISKKFTSFFFGEQEEAPKEEEEVTALPVIAEAEEAPIEQPPPPPPARRWFSRTEPEPEHAPPKTEEMYNQIAAWYNEPENAALRARWGPFPDPDEFQTWPGFVRVTNAFLDARLIEVD
jgi:surface protein